MENVPELVQNVFRGRFGSLPVGGNLSRHRARQFGFVGQHKLGIVNLGRCLLHARGGHRASGGSGGDNLLALLFRHLGDGCRGWQRVYFSRQTLRQRLGGFDAFDQNNNVWSPNELFFEAIQALPGESVESGGRSAFFNWNLNAIHDYVGSGWGANTAVGMQYEDRRLNTYQIRTQNLLPGQRNVNQGTNFAVAEGLTQERTIAFYAQESIRLLEEKLLVQLGLRAERSSVNGDVDKYYIFPKASASYRFIGLLGDGSEVKVRGAYGETGNQPLFGQKFTNLGTPQLGGQQGITVSTAAGFAGVEPERLKEFEGGVDGEMYNGRLTWELTGFVRNTTNLLLQRVTRLGDRLPNGG
jgi:hypothetical protein